LIHPIEGMPTPSASGTTRYAAIHQMSPGVGLMVAAGTSLGLWAGVAKLMLVVLR
jgi:hypothetical protein